MQKLVKEYAGPIVIGLVLLAGLLAATSAVAFKLGERHIAELVLHSSVPDGKRSSTPPEDYDKTIGKLRSDLNRLTNDYDSACANYQTLYSAYDALYRQAGASLGHKQIALPDGARGNPESCYR